MNIVTTDYWTMPLPESGEGSVDSPCLCNTQCNATISTYSAIEVLNTLYYLYVFSTQITELHKFIQRHIQCPGAWQKFQAKH